jgi:DNA-binding NarL/FixJ family response regulator
MVAGSNALCPRQILSSVPSDETSMSATKLKVVIVDDHPFFREGITNWIQKQGVYDCCGYASSPETALETVARLKPALVLLDLQLGDYDAVPLIKKLLSIDPNLRILVLSQRDELVYGPIIFREGAHGYVMKEAAAGTVLTAIQTIFSGQFYASPKLAVQMVTESVHSQRATDLNAIYALSTRETQVFTLLGAGKNNKEIAAELNISPKTVETYRESIKKKLHLPNSIMLLQKATLWANQRQLNH